MILAGLKGIHSACTNNTPFTHFHTGRTLSASGVTHVHIADLCTWRTTVYSHHCSPPARADHVQRPSAFTNKPQCSLLAVSTYKVCVRMSDVAGDVLRLRGCH